MMDLPRYLWLLLAIVGPIFLLGLVQRVFWWAGKLRKEKLYAPFGIRVCQWVYDARPQWIGHGKGLFLYKPEGATVTGAFFAMIWPALVVFNVALLAQILEMWLPAGGRIRFPWLGTYAVFPLIAGFLWAITQTLLGVSCKMTDGRKISGKLLKVMLGFIVFLTIVFEAGLAIYRARMLAAGEEMLTTSLVDKFIFQYGPLMAGFLGLVVPIGESWIGGTGYVKFVAPVTGAAASRWVPGILVLGWSLVAGWLCGFYPERPCVQEEVIVSPSVANLPRNTPKLEGQVNSLYRQVQRLQERMLSIKDRPEAFDSLQPILDEFQNRQDQKKQQWKSNTDELYPAVEQTATRGGLRRIKRAIKVKKATIDDEARNIQRELNLLGRRIITLPRDIKQWKRTIDQFRNELKETTERAKSLKSSYSLYRGFYDQLPEEHGHLFDNLHICLLFDKIRTNTEAIEGILVELGDEFKVVGRMAEATVVPSQMEQRLLMQRIMEGDIDEHKKMVFGDLGDLKRMCNLRSIKLLWPWYGTKAS